MEPASHMDLPSKRALLQVLQGEILRAQGMKIQNKGDNPIDLGPVNQAFPGAVFPLGTIHEVLTPSTENGAAAQGFIATISQQILRKKGTAIWILKEKSIFPPAFAQFGLLPHQIIFIRLKKERDIHWTLEESLKCPAVNTVVAESQDLDFTCSRRLQLATEQSKVTGFVLRKATDHLKTTASTARWKISSLPSLPIDDLPGLGFPRWEVELLKIRNGKPGKWIMEWKHGQLVTEQKEFIISSKPHIKIA